MQYPFNNLLLAAKIGNSGGWKALRLLLAYVILGTDQRADASLTGMNY